MSVMFKWTDELIQAHHTSTMVNAFSEWYDLLFSNSWQIAVSAVVFWFKLYEKCLIKKKNLPKILCLQNIQRKWWETSFDPKTGCVFNSINRLSYRVGVYSLRWRFNFVRWIWKFISYAIATPLEKCDESIMKSADFKPVWLTISNLILFMCSRKNSAW